MYRETATYMYLHLVGFPLEVPLLPSWCRVPSPLTTVPLEVPLLPSLCGVLSPLTTVPLEVPLLPSLCGVLSPLAMVQWEYEASSAPQPDLHPSPHTQKAGWLAPRNSSHFQPFEAEETSNRRNYTMLLHALLSISVGGLIHIPIINR